MSEPAPTNVMEQIVSLCKRRGFIYPASEIYGGIKGFWDYGPLGVLLKNNIRDWWWKQMVLTPPIGPDGRPVEMVGLDSAIIQNPKTWIASGHVAGFNDPMIDDKVTKKRYRADHLWVFFPRTVGQRESFGIAVEASSYAEAVSRFDEIEDRNGYHKVYKDAQRRFGFDPEGVRGYGAGPAAKIGSEELATTYAPDSAETGRLALPAPKPATALSESERRAVYPPDAVSPNEFTEPRAFNLMFETYVGALASEDSKAYLRPETAQGIFLNFKNVVDTTRVKVPFGVAQVGKSFRNEVTPRNYIFRSREFEQMEMEWFCPPDDALAWYDFWKHERMRWWESLGVSKENLRFRDHGPEELAHYSKACVDIEYKYPFTAPDFGELEGIAHRGSFDLTQHQTHSGQKLDYFDQELQLKLKEQGASPDEVKAKSRYVPNVIEPASGLTRAVLVLLCEAYRRDETRPSGEYLAFHPRFAPVKAGVFPLVNKDGMPEVAEKLYLQLRQRFTCEYDPKQSIGKRYARMDEIGTPYCVTVDGDTLKDQTVTVRNRDDASQQRIAIDQVESFMRERVNAD